MVRYALPRTGSEELERERLDLLQQANDPLTTRQLDSIGVGEGWRCLDVGAGGGTVTRMLADSVGPTGSVLATDLDTRLLEPLAGGPVEVRRHDLLADPLPDSGFDLAHARLVLIHLPSRLEALRRIVASVRPGAWVALVDVDFSAVRLLSTSAAWQRAWSAFMDSIVAAGWDPRYGARLVDDIEALELEDIDDQRVEPVEQGGAVHARLLGLTFERLRGQMLTMGASEADVDEARRLLLDPAERWELPATTGVTARRPS